MISKKLLALSFLFCSFLGRAQDTDVTRSLEIYGFAMLDVGYNFNTINPNWFDALRLTRLPSYKGEFAPDGKVFFGVRQTRFGVRGWTQTPVGELTGVFDFDLFGVGVDEGQTTMRVRNAYGEIGRWLFGQANTPFMDGDVFPNTMEYWGPTGMVFFRNVQLRYAAMQGTNEVFIAIERPGASPDLGPLEGRIELDSVKGRLKLPDFTAHYKRSGDWGHVQIAGMLRFFDWEDIHTTGGYDLSGKATAWGLHLSSVLNLGKKDVFRGAVVYGEGIENTMNDAPTDIGVKATGNAAKPLDGKPLPILGITAWLEHSWRPDLMTAIGYSMTDIDNTDLGSPDAYKRGQYAIVNLVYTPFKNALIAAELQYGKRENFSDGFSSDATKIHFAFKYSFSQIFYKKKEQ